MAHDNPKSRVNFSLDEPNDHDSIESLIDQYLESAIDTSSPHFYNQLFSGFSTIVSFLKISIFPVSLSIRTLISLS